MNISEIQHIGTGKLDNITGITVYNDDVIIISAKDSINTLAYYNYDIKCKKIYNGPNYINCLLGIDVKSISAIYNKFIVVVLKSEFKVVLITGKKEEMTTSTTATTRYAFSVKPPKQQSQCCKMIFDEQVELRVYNDETKTLGDIRSPIVNAILSIHANAKCLNLMSTQIVDSIIYFFVMGNVCNQNVLYVCSGTINLDNITINKNVSVDSFFNLYTTGKSAGLDKCNRKTLIFGDVAFNSINDTFVVLLIYGEGGKHGLITKLNRYDQTNSIGSLLKFITKLTSKPRGITHMTCNNYAVITNDKKDDLTKYFIVNIQ